MTSSSAARPIAILGATSRIAMDYIVEAARSGHEFALYARRPEALSRFLADNALPANWAKGVLPAFADARPASFRAIVNFVGVGDPAAAKAMGADIFSATRDSDALALAYAVRHPDTPYVFMSSGAVYGTDYEEPATAATQAAVPINALAPSNYYSVAKLYAEALHRAADATVIDVRIFNYVSRNLDLSSRFLLTDLVRCIRDGTPFETKPDNIWRDFLHPEDFFRLMTACIGAPPGTNRPVDAYSGAPIDKRSLLTLLAREFGLRYAITDQDDAVRATGTKPRYYSLNRAAAELGYEPRWTSESGVLQELRAINSKFQPNR